MNGFGPRTGRRSMRAAGAFIATAGTALTLASCSAGGSQPAQTSHPEPGDFARPRASATAPAGPAGATAPAAPPQRSRQPIATANGSNDGEQFMLAITELRRRGRTVQLSGLVSVRGDTKSVSPTIALSPGGVEFSVAGISLVDGASATRFLPVTTGDDDCVCTRGPDLEATPGHPVPISVTLTAPPPTVSSVDIVSPRTETMTDVPLTQ